MSRFLQSWESYQVAWPFAPIDQGDEGDFIERWLGWFAEGAQGLLRHPSSMPERRPEWHVAT